MANRAAIRRTLAVVVAATACFEGARKRKRTSKCSCPGSSLRAGIGWMSTSNTPGQAG